MNKAFSHMKKIISASMALILSASLLGGFAGKETLAKEEYSEYERELLDIGFPESYLPYLVALHEEHPKWIFNPFLTGLDWNTVMENEMVIKRNLIPASGHSMTLKGLDDTWYQTPTAWKSIVVEGAFDWSANDWITYDSGAWVQASHEAVAYVMDPRNWMTNANVFEFEQLSLNKNLSNKTYLKALNNMMKNTYMQAYESGNYVGGTVKDGVGKTYAEVLLEAGEEYDVSPIALCARLIQEKGTGHKDDKTNEYGLADILGNGVVTDDEGATFHAYNPKTDGKKRTVYYNFFNIGASGTGYEEIINNGGREAYNAGWTSQYKAIMGGASKFVSGYIAIGQDTLYFQKFSVCQPYYYYWKQYMQNLIAPVNEGWTNMRSYESLGLLESAFTFHIPVYLNMPKDPCPSPSLTYGTSTANPNDKLKSLKVETYSLLKDTQSYTFKPQFHMDTLSYSMTVPYEVASLKIQATAIDAGAKVSGTGTKNLSVGKNTFKIKCTSAFGTTRTYKLTVTRGEGANLLDSLSVKGVPLAQAFQDTCLNYSGAVTVDVKSTTISYQTKTDLSYVVLRFKDQVIPLGTGSQTSPALSLSEGLNEIYLDVYASETDMDSIKTYQIDIHRVKKLEIITDYAYTSSYVSGLEMGTTVKEFLSAFKVKNATAKVLAPDGTKKSSSSVIATGDKLQITDLTGKVKTRKILLFGDVSLDGEIDLVDFSYIRNQVLKGKGLSSSSLKAADLNHDGVVDGLDFVIIKRYILYNKPIDQTM